MVGGGWGGVCGDRIDEWRIGKEKKRYKRIGRKRRGGQERKRKAGQGKAKERRDVQYSKGLEAERDEG